MNFGEDGIYIFGYFEFDMLPGQPGGHAPVDSEIYASEAQKIFVLDRNICQSVTERWKLNVSQLGRAGHLRREKGKKRATDSRSGNMPRLWALSLLGFIWEATNQ